MRAFALAAFACCLSIPTHANPRQREADILSQDVEMAQFIVHASWAPECPGVVIDQHMKDIAYKIFRARGADMKHPTFNIRMAAENKLADRRTMAERCYAAVRFLEPYGVIRPR